jgi:hypothetical protein
MPMHIQIFVDQLTPISTRGTNYAHIITNGTPGLFRTSDSPAAAFFSSKFRQGLGLGSLGSLASCGGFGVESTS